jgi:hypothetical protein
MWIRLKLIAPFQRPREPRLLLPEAWPLPFDLRDLAMGALRFHEIGLARHGGAAQLLLE